MRKVLALGAAVLFIGSVGVAGAQERLPQSSPGPDLASEPAWETSLGVRAARRPSIGPHLSIGSAKQKRFMVAFSRSIYPAARFIWRQVAARTMKAVQGQGAMSSLTLYTDAQTNMDQIRVLNAGDDIAVQVVESANANAQQGVYGTGRKLVREVYLMRGNEKLAGFGGLGQRPNPDD